MIATLALLAALNGPEILGVSCASSSGGTSLKVLASKPLEGVSMDRFGDELRITVPASLPSQGISLPALLAPVRAVSFQANESNTSMRVQVATGSIAEAHTEGAVVVITLRGGEREESSAPADVEQLFPSLFPTEPGAAAPSPSPTSEPTSSGAGGLHLGPVRITPGATLRFVDADGTYLNTPQPTRARYFEIDPVLNVEPDGELLGGRLTGSYAPRLRRGANGVPVLDETSHFLNGTYVHPLGAMWQVSVADQYSRGSIETQVVDPGREYFFDIVPFERNEVSLGLRTESDGRLQLSLSGAFAKETLAPTAGYFSNDRRSAGASLRYELGPDKFVGVSYGFEQVPPPPDRPVAETRAHTASLTLDGKLTTTLSANLSAGYRMQTNPSAPAAGDHFDGLVFGARLRREFGEGGEISASASRSTQLSAFESNAFYVATGMQAGVRVPLPRSFQLSAGASYQWNGYALVASGLTVPRDDKLFGWTLGLGRSITRWAFARVDYVADRRTSNVPGLSTRTHSFTASLGLGMTGGR